jgi:hypothetical protein
MSHDQLFNVIENLWQSTDGGNRASEDDEDLPSPCFVDDGKGQSLGFLQTILPFRRSHWVSYSAVAMLIVIIVTASVLVHTNIRRVEMNRMELAELSKNKDSMVSLDLSPQIVVRGGEATEVPTLKVSVPVVRLMLHVPKRDIQALYEVSLIDSYDRVLFTLKGVTCLDGEVIPIRLSKHTLPKGGYRLAVSHGEEAPIYYLFTVVQNE